jgi:hypothetical protein
MSWRVLRIYLGIDSANSGSLESKGRRTIGLIRRGGLA